MTNIFVQEFTGQSIYRMEENTQKIIKCFQEIDETEIWTSTNNASNSIGNLIMHLRGNIRQYVISALGTVKDTRERQKEFSVKALLSKSELINKLLSTVSEAVGLIKNMDEERLTKVYTVQGFNLSGIGIIIHVTEHYSYHTGQIVFRTKQIINKDLGFYADIDLNAKNTGS